MSVKPHASPVLHAINYLLGELDERYLTTLREFGGLQSYPSRGEGPGPRRLLHRLGRHRRHRPDLGRARPPLRRRASFGGARHRAGSTRWSATPSSTRAPAGRRSSTRWSAELGEVVLDRRPQPAVAGPGRAQHRRRPGCRACSPPPAGRCSPSSTGGCWRSCSPGPAATRCARRIDEMANPEYQRLLRCTPDAAARAAARRRAGRRRDRRAARRARRRHAARRASATSAATTSPRCGDAFAAIDDTRPTVIFAYTVKGYGLATRGPPAEPLLAADRRADAASWPQRVGHRPGRRRGPRFPPASPAGRAVRATAATGCAARAGRAARRAARCPTDIGRTPTGTATTQAALGPRAARPHPRGARGGAARGHASARTSARRPTSAAG